MSEIKLKRIVELLGESFFIPSYQRGYRWRDTQVTQLLSDILEFAKKHQSGKDESFYCLQPIVVKKRVKKNDGDTDEWEVIDGQQRLTTLYLILQNLERFVGRSINNFTKISYETRIKTDEDSIGSEEFLKNVTQYKNKSEDNIDFLHIWNAYHTIDKWFITEADNPKSEFSNPRIPFTEKLLSNTKVIWYEVTDSNNLIDIFDRLNRGKIPLTNAELIKALFLQESNFPGEVDLKQIQIASEWDAIEKALQDDSFWFFIYNPENPLKYDNRIEYIFDLMKKRTKESENYHTFNEFYQEFKDNKFKMSDIWLRIKQYFLTFDEWFKDYELFHYVGYLIECAKDNSKNIIDDIKKRSIGCTKKEFKEYLKSEIRKHVRYDIRSLEYSNQADKIKITNVLLLFNIQTVLQTQKSDMRFPFHKYKADNWDIEHVRSQTAKNFKEDSERLDWAKDILEYFTGFEFKDQDEKMVDKEEIEKAKCEIEKLPEASQKLCKLLINLLQSDKIEDEFESCYKIISDSEFFCENDIPPSIHKISNLALLDFVTNRSYKNAFFPIKRKRIIENDKNGIFTPICTKNLFLKYYSKKMDEVMFWNDDDATNYFNAIMTTLKDFLPKGDKQ